MNRMRKRYISPEVIRDSRLKKMSMTARVLAFSLPCLANKEGRLIQDLPRMKADLFPYDSDLPIAELVDELCDVGWIITYSAKIKDRMTHLIQICEWDERYSVSPNEKMGNGELPPPEGGQLQLLASLNSTQRRVTSDKSLSIAWLVNSYNYHLGHMKKANMKQSLATKEAIQKKHIALEGEYKSLGVEPEEYWDGVFAGAAVNEFFCKWFQTAKGASFRWFFTKSNEKLTTKFEARPGVPVESICGICKGSGQVKTENGIEECWGCAKSKMS